MQQELSGNSVYDEFDDGHDASVPSGSYVGQLIYINSLVLDMVDGEVSSRLRLGLGLVAI